MSDQKRRDTLEALKNHRDEDEGWMYAPDVAEEARVGDVMVYKYLTELERDGLVDARWSSAALTGGSSRRQYRAL